MESFNVMWKKNVSRTTQNTGRGYWSHILQIFQRIFANKNDIADDTEVSDIIRRVFFPNFKLLTLNNNDKINNNINYLNHSNRSVKWIWK